MSVTYTPIGRAVAIAKGHYPTADGRHASIAAGETFTVWQGLDKGKWFTLLPKDAPAPVKVTPPAPAEPDTLAAAAKVERKRKAEVKPPLGADDLV